MKAQEALHVKMRTLGGIQSFQSTFHHIRSGGRLVRMWSIAINFHVISRFDRVIVVFSPNPIPCILATPPIQGHINELSHVQRQRRFFNLLFVPRPNFHQVTSQFTIHIYHRLTNAFVYWYTWDPWVLMCANNTPIANSPTQPLAQ